MAIVTTFVCDVTGETGNNQNDFCNVEIACSPIMGASYETVRIKKLVKKELAKKLGLAQLTSIEAKTPPPEIAFESKLRILLENFVEDLVQGHLDNVQ